MAGKGKPFVPFLLPVFAFIATIFCGAILLSLPFCGVEGKEARFVDAFFISTSAVCVTGLASVDLSSTFNLYGQIVILFLIQLGGLGITTYTTLIWYLASKRITLTDKLIGQALLLDSSFHLGRFLKRVIVVIVCVELSGACLLYLKHEGSLSFFNALFIAVSSFCNAGFALWSNNLVPWADSWFSLGIVSLLIVLGGIGFFVLDEFLLNLFRAIKNLFKGKRVREPFTWFGYYSRLVVMTSLFLIFFGGALIFFIETNNENWSHSSWSNVLLTSLFHSVSSRTAGFASVDLLMMSDLSLLIIMVLMFIGGSPGSCAGGIKTTSFRALLSYIRASFWGREQVLVQGKALESWVISRLIVLIFFSLLLIFIAVFSLSITENGIVSFEKAPFPFFSLLFEVVSAFGTVGLSLDVTPRLSEAGKYILCVVMFIGRIGPIWLLSSIQQLQKNVRYSLPSVDLPIG